jgi:pimeloyl-ACP methyl ester carboxylesterase
MTGVTLPCAFGAGNSNRQRYTPVQLVARGVAYGYTHPREVKKLAGINHMLSPQHLSMFEPIMPTTFESADGTRLQGYWLPASDERSQQTVVLGHGYSADWREMLATAQSLRQKGYHCFLFDFRAHGKSGGDQTSIGFHEGKDIAGAVRHVLATHPDRAKRLFYVGHSMGSAAFLMAPKSLEPLPLELARLEKHLKGVVLDVPYYSFREIATRFVKHMNEIEPNNKLVAKVIHPFLSSRMGDKLLQAMEPMFQQFVKTPVNLFNVIPAQILAQAPLGKRPVLVSHGDRDSVTPYDHGQRVYETLRATHPTQTQFLPLPGADHMNRAWQPANLPKPSWSAERNNLSEAIDQFFRQIPFAGRWSSRHAAPEIRQSPIRRAEIA